MGASRNVVLFLALAALAVQLAACASLPKAQTAGFKTLASGSEAGLAALSGAQADELARQQLALVAQGRKRVSPAAACFQADSVTDPCVLVVRDPAGAGAGSEIALGSQTMRMQKLLEVISVYAGAMNALAEAKDLEKAADATGKATASLKSLVATVYPPGEAAAGAAMDALAFGAQQLRLRERRALMVRIAATADPVVEKTAAVLGREAGQLRGSLLDIRKTQLRQAIEALDEAKPAADPDKASAARAKLIDKVSAAAAAVSQARAVRTDFTPLARSHRLMLEALRDPRTDLTTGVAEAQAFQDALKTMTNLEPGAASAPDKSDSGSEN
jgi:hypothetical protein